MENARFFKVLNRNQGTAFPDYQVEYQYQSGGLEHHN